MNYSVLLCEQLGIQYPIIQADMAGDGITTPILVAAVFNAEGLGTAYMQPKAIQANDAVNVFCASE